MMEKKEMDEKNSSFRGIMSEFMGYTTGHGFGRLIAATSILWRIFWVLAVIGAFGMFVFEVIQLFKLFLSRPVQTSVSVTFEKVRFRESCKFIELNSALICLIRL
jgi:hypothetical protein